TGVEHGRQDVVLTRPLQRNRDDAHPCEVEGDAARVGDRSTVTAEPGADLNGRAVLVIGEALDHEPHPVRPVALVHDGRVLDRIAIQPRPALDRAVDVVAGDGVLLRLVYRVRKGRIPGEVGPADAGRYLDVLDVLGERLGTLRIDDGF